MRFFWSIKNIKLSVYQLVVTLNIFQASCRKEIDIVALMRGY